MKTYSNLKILIKKLSISLIHIVINFLHNITCHYMIAWFIFIFLIKTVSIYRNVDNPELFEKFYIKVVFPRLHKIPGVLYTDVTKVVLVSEEKVSENFKGTELILETYFESYQVLESILLHLKDMSLCK